MKRQMKTAMALTAGEFLFVVVPLVILAVVYSTGRVTRMPKVMESTEWSFAAVVLGGQAVVKLFVGGATNRSVSTPRVALFAIAVLIVVVLPATIILVQVLREEETPPIPMHLLRFQFVWFVLAAMAFFVCGTVGELLRERL
jgi:hypothetical protein